MKAHRTLLLAVLFKSMILTGCSDCGQSAVGTKTGSPLEWESIPLGIDENGFRDHVAKLFSLDEAVVDERIPCRDQDHLSVPDVDEKIVVERSAGNHTLTNCVLNSKVNEASSPLIGVRAEFIDHHLTGLSYRFAPKEHDRLNSLLKERFGPGLYTTFQERTTLEKTSLKYQLWRFDDTLWIFSEGSEGTALLTHHDLAASRVLPKPLPPSKRGKPISLDDIGIGKLDLDAPDPEIELPDASLGGTGDR
ncbi:MAG: hypothetical protein GY847_03865 [Proteobacteria bacterium]|nr:hypothetical protein [Pseudomonadota bacterium]